MSGQFRRVILIVIGAFLTCPTSCSYPSTLSKRICLWEEVTRTLSISSEIGHNLNRLSLLQVINWNLRSSSSGFWPPRVLQTNSCTPFFDPSNRATLCAVLLCSILVRPQMERAKSLRWGIVRTPRPNGRYRARQTGAEVLTVRTGLETSFVSQYCWHCR